MKKVFLYGLPLMVAGSIYCSAANAADVITTSKNTKATELFRSLKQKRHGAPKVNAVGFKNAMAPKAGTTLADPIAQIKGDLVQFLSDEEGNIWYYTQKNTKRDDLFNSYITKSEITIYNNNHELAGTITVDVPEDMSVNMITPYGTITKKFFDLNDKDSELLVELHEVGNAENNYQDTYHTHVYHLDGTKATEYEGAGVFLNIVKNAWTKYQRFVLTNSKFEEVPDKTYPDGSPYKTSMAHINIYKPASYGSSEPTMEKEFAIDNDYTYYGNDETPMTIYNVDGDPYYVISHYSKIYDSGEIDETTQYFIPTKDNSVIIKSYDKNYTLVDDLDIPIPAAPDTDYRMAQFGKLSEWSITRNKFTNDGKLSYVIAYVDMTTKVDDFRYSFVTYNNEGKEINTICDGVYKTWFNLSDIPGAEKQMAFMQFVDDDEEQQQIKIVNLPSLTDTKIMRAVIEDNTISTVLNRYGKADDYKYIVKVSTGDVDNDGNVIAKIMWLDKDLKFDHFTKFNLGQDAENFSLTLSDAYTNPYLFNTNDKLEFFFQAKVKQNGSSKLDNVYMVGDEDGNILHSFENGEKGRIMSMGCFDSGANGNELYTAYSNDDNKSYTYEFFKLPLTKFEKGGTGTKEDPYLVASAGDMLQISTEPGASYKMVDNIDMDTYNNISASWEPIADFTGSFDGDNHAITNLNINTTSSSVGIFGNLQENAEVKNLVIAEPNITLTDNNSTVGTLAASAIKSNVSNVHVYDAKIAGDASATVGGIVGEGALETNISEVSFNDGEINAPNAGSVGGIIGDIRTSTVVEAAAVKNTDITAARTVGGIVGAAMQSTVKNSRFNGKLTAENTVGGIMGNSNAAVVDKCIFDGTVKATMPNWTGFAAAGIIGSLDADWSGSTTPIVKNNIVKGEIIAEETATDGEAGDGGEAFEDKTVHRIVGYTIANEYYEENETPRTEARLSANWAVNTTKVKGATVTSADGNSVEGLDVAETDITKESLTGVGYGFGTEAATPWKESGATFPVLFFENDVKALVLSDSYITMEKDATAEIEAQSFGNDKTAISATSSAPAIVEVSATESKDGTAKFTLTAKADGAADINVTAGNITVVCQVVVSTPSGIETATVANGNSMRILPGNGFIKAEGATSISVYAANGSNVAKVNGSTVSTSQMGKGLFIVVATDAQGNKQNAKVIIK